MLNLILVRHGETDWNHEQRIQGQLDIPLNKNGTKQARAVFSKLKKEPIDAIFSSDLTHTRQSIMLRPQEDLRVEYISVREPTVLPYFRHLRPQIIKL